MSVLPKVSIIVPIYNVEKYLRKCVNSLINQSYKNIEIILVDDGGKDACSNICDEYNNYYDYIKVIHKKNGGLSDARNAGIDIATGEYIFFVDSDDYIFKKTIEIMIEKAIKYKVDIVECEVLYVSEMVNDPFENVKEEYKIDLYSHDEAVNKILNYDFKIMAWNKLYSKRLFENIRYPIGKLHEDEFTTPYLVDKCNKYCKISIPLYAYVQRNNSIMSAEFNIRRLDIIEAHQKRIEFFNNKYNNKYNYEMKYHFFVACTKLSFIMGNNYKGSIVEQISSELKRQLLTIRVPIKIKIKTIMYLILIKTRMYKIVRK